MPHYHKCFVPNCPNSTSKTKDKVFVHVNEFLKRKWCNQLNIADKSNKRIYCCEDHFNLEEDLENYYQWKLMNARPKLKISTILQYSCENVQAASSEAETEADDTACLEEKEIWADLTQLPECAECGRAADRDGKLFQCVECPRVVCADCERADRHRQHCMLRLPSRAIYDKLKMLYESMRDAVVSRLDYLELDVKPKDEPIFESDPLNMTLTEEFIRDNNEHYSEVNTVSPNRILENERTSAQSVTVPSSVPIVKSGRETKFVPAVNCVPISKLIRKSYPQIESAPEEKSVLLKLLKDLHKPTSVIEAEPITQLKPVTVNNLPVTKSEPGEKYVLLPKSELKTIYVPKPKFVTSAKPVLVVTSSESKSETEFKFAPDVKSEPEEKSVPVKSASDPHDHSYSIISASAAQKSVYKTDRPNSSTKECKKTSKRKKSNRNDDDEYVYTHEFNISEAEMTDEEGW